MRLAAALGAGAIVAPMLLAAPAIAADGAYPIDAMFAEFAKACGPMPDYDGTVASVAEAGWESTDRAGVPALASFMEFAEDAGQKAVAEMGGTMSPAAIFRNTVGGEDVAIVVTEVTVHGGRVTGCRLFDPAETRDAGVAKVKELAGSEPVQTIEREGNTIVKFEGLSPTTDSFDYYFVPAGSPLESHVHFNGLAMKIDSIGPVAND